MSNNNDHGRGISSGIPSEFLEPGMHNIRTADRPTICSGDAGESSSIFFD